MKLRKANLFINLTLRNLANKDLDLCIKYRTVIQIFNINRAYNDTDMVSITCFNPFSYLRKFN